MIEAFVLGVQLALAPFPRYPVADFCRPDRQEIGRLPSYGSTEDECRVRDQLWRTWPSVADTPRLHECLERTGRGSRSYLDLAACLGYMRRL